VSHLNDTGPFEVGSWADANWLIQIHDATGCYRQSYLRTWRGCCLIRDRWPVGLRCIVIPDDGPPTVPPAAMAYAVAALEAGQSVVNHTRTDEVVTLAAVDVMSWFGGGLA
jgi:hypothetical protein